MALDRTRPRPDLGYLRRRPRRGEAPAPPPAAASTGSLSLSLGPPPAQRSTLRAPAAVPAAPPGHRASGRTILGPAAPAVTLDRRQSAIGSLEFQVTPQGRVSAVWELVDGTSGLVSEQGELTSPEFGRRGLVQWHKGRLLVGLRHVQQLRRLLVVIEASPQAPAVTTVAALYGGVSVESAHETHVPALVSLALYQVDGELAIRREGAGFPSLEEAAAAYGFAATWTPPPVGRVRR